MLLLPQFKGRTVGVLGLGRNGATLVEALLASGANVLAWDAGAARRADISIDCVPPQDWKLTKAAAVIFADGERGGLSREVVQRAEKAGVEILTELDVFSQALKNLPTDVSPKVIAVTGAAGKSVTVSIIDHVLRENGWGTAIAGDPGLPLFSLRPGGARQAILVELPVRRLATARQFHCEIAVVLNVPTSRTKEEVEMALRSLLRIFHMQGPNDTAIIGVDDALGQKLCTQLRSGRAGTGRVGTVVPISGEASLGHGVIVLDATAYAVKKGKSQHIGDFSRAEGFIGAHFNQAVAAAVATCLRLNVAPTGIVKALHSYRGLTGRFECLGAAGPVLFVDDSYARSAAAAERAVSACPNVFWIGGAPPDADEIVLPSSAALHGTYFVSPAGRHLHADGHAIPTHPDLRSAFQAAFDDASALAQREPGIAPVVLFAPGCPPEAGGYAPDEFRRLAGLAMGGQVANG